MNSTRGDKYWTTIIKPKAGFFHLNYKETFQYLDLIRLFVKRSFKVTYKQTLLGPIWLLIKPLVTAVMYTFVFGQVVGIKTDGVPQMLFYMVSNTTWAFFSSCIGATSSIFTGNAGLYGKIYFPRLVVPFSSALTNFYNYLITLGFFIVIEFFYTAAFGWKIYFGPALILLPLSLLIFTLLGMGVGLIISSLTIRYRDLSMMVGYGISFWMYITPVIYPLSQFPDRFHNILLLNPAAPLMQTVRWALLGGFDKSIAPYYIGSAVFSVLIFLYGTMLFNRAERTFVDIV